MTDIPTITSLLERVEKAEGMAAFSGTAGVSYGPHDIAGRAYEVADAMIAARTAREASDAG